MVSVISASNNEGSVLAGTSGDDTLISSFGSDTLTGGAGSDTFTFKVVPWSPGQVTDFTPGVDKLDISLILHSDGYTGSNPIADHWLYLVDDGHGGTMVEIDQDGPGSVAGWADSVTDLLGVSPSSLQLNRDIIWQSDLPLATSGSKASGGPGNFIVAPSGYPTAVTGTPGDDTLVASQAGDTLSGGAGRDLFKLSGVPDAPVVITDFTPGADQLDLTALAPGYHGTNPMGDGYLDFGPDGSGGTYVWLDPDGPGPQYESIVADLKNVGWTMLQIGRDVLIGGATAGGVGADTGSGSSSGPSSPASSSGGSTSPSGAQGGTVMTGTSGADTFTISSVPSSPDQVNGFTPGQDRLDLSALFEAAGYHGSYPGKAGYLALVSDGQGGTDVWFNPAGTGGTNGFLVADLSSVSPASINTARDINFGQFGFDSSAASAHSSSASSSVSSANSAPAPTASAAGETLVDNTSTGTVLVGGPGDDTLIAGSGPDLLVGGGGADTFVFNTLPYNSGHVSDFTVGQDVLDLRGIASAYGYSGTNAVADGWLILRDDGRGDTQVFVNTHDGSHAHIVTVLDGVSAASIHQGDWLF